MMSVADCGAVVGGEVCELLTVLYCTGAPTMTFSGCAATGTGFGCGAGTVILSRLCRRELSELGAVDSVVVVGTFVC